jgi:hypothetical protein
MRWLKIRCAERSRLSTADSTSSLARLAGRLFNTADDSRPINISRQEVSSISPGHVSSSFLMARALYLSMCRTNYVTCIISRKHHTRSSSNIFLCTSPIHLKNIYLGTRESPIPFSSECLFSMCCALIDATRLFITTTLRHDIYPGFGGDCQTCNNLQLLCAYINDRILVLSMVFSAGMVPGVSPQDGEYEKQRTLQ